MGGVRVDTRAAKARLGYFTGLGSTALGLGAEIGAGWGAVVVGLGIATWFVLLYDVDEPVTEEQELWPHG